MGAIRTAGNLAFRNYVTEGVSASGANPVSKTEARAAFAAVEDFILSAFGTAAETLSGAWSFPISILQGVTTGAVTAGRMYLFPIVLRQDVDRIAVQYSSGTGGNVRMGIYADSSGLPGALVIDGGAQAVGAGLNEMTITLTALDGVYWLACIFSGTPTMILGTPTGHGIGAPNGSFTTAQAAAYVTRAYGALPASAGSISGLTPTAPLIGVRNG